MRDTIFTDLGVDLGVDAAAGTRVPAGITLTGRAMAAGTAAPPGTTLASSALSAKAGDSKISADADVTEPGPPEGSRITPVPLSGVREPY